MKFERGLKSDPDTQCSLLINRLNSVYELGGWWKTIADDPQLFIAIRDEYLNVYWKGSSLLKLYMQDGHLTGDVHYKYLLKPEIKTSPYLKIKDGQFQSVNTADFFVSDLSDMGSLKRAADYYAGEEKAGVHKIVMSNPNIIDVEVAFATTNEQSGAKVAQRIDFAALRLGKDGPEITFYEAKRFDNPELRADGERTPPVLKQLKNYRDFLRDAQLEVAESYRKVCGNLLSLHGVRDRFLSMHNLLRDVAEGNRVLTINCEVRLVVFGYDRDQDIGPVWGGHREKLINHLGQDIFLQKGNPKGLKKGISLPIQ